MAIQQHSEPTHKKLKRQIKKYFKTNENEKATYQSLWETA